MGGLTARADDGMGWHRVNDHGVIREMWGRKDGARVWVDRRRQPPRERPPEAAPEAPEAPELPPEAAPEAAPAGFHFGVVSDPSGGGRVIRASDPDTLREVEAAAGAGGGSCDPPEDPARRPVNPVRRVEEDMRIAATYAIAGACLLVAAVVLAQSWRRT